ncbi:ABC transporter permease [Alicyclobacillus acidiphilus]|uniref:ABC transporter permease n=1 Tax=Alicyclobacillus acidiphilus TaxID=182455 RepID=UPI0008354C50|nr:ABC transporter permease [Alicyclobacillus acidiphilus]
MNTQLRTQRKDGIVNLAIPASSSAGWFRLALRRYAQSSLGRVGACLLVVLVLFCFLGPVLDPASPNQINLIAILHPPTWAFPFGTDELGRDLLIRTMIGGQASLEVGFAAAIASMAVGIFYGLVSGYFGGWLDHLMMRIVDVLRAVPTLFLLVFFDSAFRPNVGLLIFLIAITSWHGVSRLVRADVLAVRQMLYVDAAKISGASHFRILVRHILPNIMGTVLVSSTFMVGDAVLLIASLSFLGLGLPPPAPNWGSMLSDSMSYFSQNCWWLIYAPGAAILTTVLAINFIGDALRTAFDMRLEQEGD